MLASFFSSYSCYGMLQTGLIRQRQDHLLTSNNKWEFVSTSNWLAGWCYLDTWARSWRHQALAASIFLYGTNGFRHFPTHKKRENKQLKIDKASHLKSRFSSYGVRLTRWVSQGQIFALHFVLLCYWSCSIRPETFKWNSELSLAGCLGFILQSLLKRQGGETELAANHIPIICQRHSQDSTC